MFTIPCQYCKGQGFLPQFKHVENGVCFTCNGSGIQEVNQDVYENYQRRIEREKQGKYILFNNGKVEYYNSEKQIEKLYGNFFSGEYANYAVKVSYKDKNIFFKKSTENNESLINEVEKEQRAKNNQNINEKIKYLENLAMETDQELKELISNKIFELKAQLTSK
jgi:DNA-directed RNA polymerase subunit N (RpoN/RPB10)